METGRKKFSPGGLLFALLFAAEACFVLDMLTTRAVSNLPAAYLAAAFGILFLLFAVLGQLSPKAMKWIFLGVTAVLLALLLFLAALWYRLYSSGDYLPGEKDKSQLYAGKRVMLLVPHEDDEINLMGGVLEQYVKYGSTVYVAYLTNGDSQFSPIDRIMEAEAAMADIGISASNLIFLGYGDSLEQEGQPIYYCDDNAQLTSRAGYSATYGIEGHPAFAPGTPYTRGNMVQDIKSLILRFTPDIIYCCDMDSHDDHQLLSLLFEEAMGQVLEQRSAYRPIVFRAFAYDTAYYAPKDYYSLNIRSTVNPGETDYISSQNSNIYNWSERLRLPVEETGLSRSLEGSRRYQTHKLYETQPMAQRADQIINGDKVFWQRETGSLSYGAEFWVSSGDAHLLQDFILQQRLEPGNPGHSGNTWVPEPEDTEKRVIIKFSEPTGLSRIVLYDNPSLEDNVLEATVRFKDGSFVMTGPLEPNGSGTEINFDRRTVEELEVVLMKTEGSKAGLTELELYSQPYQAPFSFVKLCNAQGDFIYDYYIDESGQEELSFYAYGCSDRLSDYQILCFGEGCYAQVLENSFIMHCPPGKSCTFTLVDHSGTISDTVYIRNEKTWPIKIAQFLENYNRTEFKWAANSNSAMLLDKIGQIIG